MGRFGNPDTSCDVTALRNTLQATEAAYEHVTAELAQVRDDWNKDHMEMKRSRDSWEESARQFARDVDFYRGLLRQCGQLLGKDCYTSEDGTVQEDVLAIKVPEVLHKLLRDRIDLELPDKQWSIVVWDGFHGFQWNFPQGSQKRCAKDIAYAVAARLETSVGTVKTVKGVV